MASLLALLAYLVQNVMARNVLFANVCFIGFVLLLLLFSGGKY
jgi:hypothetical protein